MKQKISFLLLILLCFSLGLPAFAETLTFYRLNNKNDGYKSFQAAHPDVQCTWTQEDYNTTYALGGALLTGEFNSDVYNMNSIFFDCQQIMSKGYCVDLSANEIIRTELEKMHPSIVSKVMQDGKIYAIPFGISYEFWSIDEEGWNAAGLTEADIPTSFPEFLDFLTYWTQRTEDEPEHEISIENGWVKELYNKHSYTSWLISILVENYIMQHQYADEPLRFDNEELISLLDRAKEVGAEIYRTEPVAKGSMKLFESVASNRWISADSALVSLRINENQPHLIKSYLSMYAINPLTSKSALSIDLLERIITNLPDLTKALFYQETDPVLNPNYEESLSSTLARIAAAEEKLKSKELDADTREELTINLMNYHTVLESTKLRVYTLSPEQLAQYQSYVDTLYFPAPSLFYIATDAGWNVQLLEDQLAAGALSSQEFVKELDRLAWMVEMEDGL
ncbi:MAG: extracellular solute-binding protein [Clostridiales bacterium]|nr:extracellular solute-binding protein [Clostridiales bacterium]